MSVQAFVDYLNKQPLSVKVAIARKCTLRSMPTVIHEHCLADFDWNLCKDHNRYYFLAVLRLERLDIVVNTCLAEPKEETLAALDAWCNRYFREGLDAPKSTAGDSTIPEAVPEPVLTVEQIAKLVRGKINIKHLMRYITKAATNNKLLFDFLFAFGSCLINREPKYKFTNNEIQTEYVTKGLFGIYEYAILSAKNLEDVFEGVRAVILLCGSEPNTNVLGAYIKNIDNNVLSAIALDIFDNHADTLGITMDREFFARNFFVTESANLALIKNAAL